MALLPYAVAAAIFNGLGAGLGQKISNRTLIAAGLLVMAGGFAVMATTTGYLSLLAGLVVMGVGGGLAGPSAYASLMGAIPLEYAGVGSAHERHRAAGRLAMSIAVLGSVLAGVFTAAMPASAPRRPGSRSAWRSTCPAWWRRPSAAFTDAVHLGSWVGAGFCVAAALLAFVVIRPAAPAAAATPEPVGV